MKIVDVQPRHTLEDYAAVAQLAAAVADLRAEAVRIARELEGRTVWMVNSTAQGGGVAEMLPAMIALLRELGVATEWAVIEAEEAAFFETTKQIHNLIHGAGEPFIDPGRRELFEEVNRRNAAHLRSMLKPGDILVVHDPQPMPLAGLLRDDLELCTVWRCHIGLDEVNRATRCAWKFLRPYAAAYDRAVFSAPEYIPDYLAGRSTIVYPAIDPLTSKNHELHLHNVVGVLSNAALAVAPGPVVRSPFPYLARRLQHDGGFAPAILPEDIGLLVRPIITQVSRWDRLKGWSPLLRAFVEMKRRLIENNARIDPIDQRRLALARLVLAGPDPDSIQDDPEGLEVLDELEHEWLELHPALQDDIALVALPMQEPRQNALMVNALQRSSSIVAQNSLREGFGLTITEAMWKRIPVLSNSRAVGPRIQIRDRLDGRLAGDPENVEELARLLEEMLRDPDAREAWGRSAQRRAQENFLIFGQLRSWLRLLESVAAGHPV